jgi:hypothetical protein
MQWKAVLSIFIATLFAFVLPLGAAHRDQFNNVDDENEVIINDYEPDFVETEISETITLQVSPLVAQRGQNITITGTVPISFVREGKLLELSMTNVWDYHDRMTVPLAIGSDRTFQYVLEGNFSGVYKVAANSAIELDAETLYVSPTLTLAIEPIIQYIQGLSWSNGSSVFVVEGEKTPTRLSAIDVNGDFWNVAHPLLGTVYQVADTNVATVDADGYVVGHTAGDTTLTATFQNQAITVPIHVVATVNEHSSRILAKLPANPIPHEPAEGEVAALGDTLTFRASPFDTSKGVSFKYSYWVIEDVDTGKRIAEVDDGTGNIATWIASNSGNYKWRMRYHFNGGQTEYTPWLRFTIR